MNYNDMLASHIEKNAELTVAGVEVPRNEAVAFGVIGCDDEFRITTWEEKPQDPKHVPGKPDTSFVSMGVYIFNTETLVKNVIADAKSASSSHDFGKDVVPGMIHSNRVFVYNFKEANNEQGRYWRDIGTLDAYWEANMDLCSETPQCNLYDEKWPIRTFQEQVPPAKIVASHKPGSPDYHSGSVVDSIISGGCVISGATVQRSVLSPHVKVMARSSVENSVLLDGACVAEGARVRNVILDHDVFVPPGFTIGYDREDDRSHFSISPNGVVIVPRGISLI
jgi:glucose-1-phosphate adenylyltransferase